MALWDIIGDILANTLANSSSKYGVRFFRKNGSLVYSSDEVTWNQVDTFICTQKYPISKTYPILQGREVLVVQSMMNAPPLDRRAYAHTVTVSGTTVSVGGGSETTLILVLMR